MSGLRELTRSRLEKTLSVAAVMAVSLWACEGSTQPTPAPPSTFVTGIQVSGPQTLAMGSTGQFRAVATFNDGSTANITSTADWSSGNSQILSVSPSGAATGVTAGETDVWVWYDYRRGFAKVLVLAGRRLASLQSPSGQSVCVCRALPSPRHGGVMSSFAPDVPG